MMPLYNACLATVFSVKVLNVHWWWLRLFAADIREAVTQELLAGTRVSRRVCAHDKSMRKAAGFAFYCFHTFAEKMESAVRRHRVRIRPKIQLQLNVAIFLFFFLKAEISVAVSHVCGTSYFVF